MPRRRPQPDLRAVSSERLGELIGYLTDWSERADGFGALALTPSGSAVPARLEELQRLFGAISEENGHLTDHVRRLEVELRKLRGELHGAVHDARTDPITGLANRRAFDLELTTIAASASRSSPAQLMMADIDHFKRVNDVHGHRIGDEVLRIIGGVLHGNVRRESLIARVGGDEFAILLPGARPHLTAGIATRLCELLATRPLAVSGLAQVIEPITLSIGVAGWRAGDSSARWYARADAALYEAKRRGRNRVSTARLLELKF
jgi:diguanylate cyclase